MTGGRLGTLRVRAEKLVRRSPYHDRWRSIRLKDFLRVAMYEARDISTLRSGGAVERFERSFARSVGAPYALLMNSGTAAIHSAYFAIGIGPGDEVIVPSYTFFATVAPMLPLGGVPVFCEIDAATLTSDPDDVERRITPRTRAICVVHLSGNPARMDRFAAIAGSHDLALIEDCSHAHGAGYRGRPVGMWGDIGCFSLQGSKPVSGGRPASRSRRTPGCSTGCWPWGTSRVQPPTRRPGRSTPGSSASD